MVTMAHREAGSLNIKSTRSVLTHISNFPSISMSSLDFEKTTFQRLVFVCVCGGGSFLSTCYCLESFENTERFSTNSHCRQVVCKQITLKWLRGCLFLIFLCGVRMLRQGWTSIWNFVLVPVERGAEELPS